MDRHEQDDGFWYNNERLEHIMKIVCGHNHTVLLLSHGYLIGYGLGTHGELGARRDEFDTFEQLDCSGEPPLYTPEDYKFDILNQRPHKIDGEEGRILADDVFAGGNSTFYHGLCGTKKFCALGQNDRG